MKEVSEANVGVFFAFLRQGFRQQAAYKVEGWLGLASSLIWFVLYAGIWTALLKGDPIALQRQMGYVVATRFLAELNFLPMWEVAAKFRQGDIGLELVKPVALPVRTLGEFLGRSAFRLLRSLPVFALIWVAFGLPFPGWSSLLLFVISGLMGWVIISTMMLALSLIALWTVQFNEAEEIFALLTSLLSGVFIPLYYLPGWVEAIARYLPFAGIYFVPSALLSGGLSGKMLLEAMALQALWAVVGLAALTAMWTAGSRKLVVQGG